MLQSGIYTIYILHGGRKSRNKIENEATTQNMYRFFVFFFFVYALFSNRNKEKLAPVCPNGEKELLECHIMVARILKTWQKKTSNTIEWFLSVKHEIYTRIDSIFRFIEIQMLSETSNSMQWKHFFYNNYWLGSIVRDYLVESRRKYIFIHSLNTKLLIILNFEEFKFRTA